MMLYLYVYTTLYGFNAIPRLQVAGHVTQSEIGNDQKCPLGSVYSRTIFP